MLFCCPRIVRAYWRTSPGFCSHDGKDRRECMRRCQRWWASLSPRLLTHKTPESRDRLLGFHGVWLYTLKGAANTVITRTINHGDTMKTLTLCSVVPYWVFTLIRASTAIWDRHTRQIPLVLLILLLMLIEDPTGVGNPIRNMYFLRSVCRLAHHSVITLALYKPQASLGNTVVPRG